MATTTTPAIPRMPSKTFDTAEAKEWSADRKEKARSQAELEFRIAKLSQWRFAVDAYVAASEGNYLRALEYSHQCRPVFNSMVRMDWLALAGYPKKALDRIKTRIDGGPGEILPLAIGVWIA